MVLFIVEDKVLRVEIFAIRVFCLSNSSVFLNLLGKLCIMNLSCNSLIIDIVYLDETLLSHQVGLLLLIVKTIDFS